MVFANLHCFIQKSRIFEIPFAKKICLNESDDMIKHYLCLYFAFSTFASYGVERLQESNENSAVRDTYHPLNSSAAYIYNLNENSPTTGSLKSEENDSSSMLWHDFFFIPSIHYRGGDGRSYSEGYESVEAFLGKFGSSYHDYLFFDFNFHRVDQGRFAANYALGLRSFNCDYDKMIGAYVSYDTRRLLRHTLNQIGVGVELLSTCWDIRANGYIPIAKKSVFQDSTPFNYPGGFSTLRKQYKTSAWGLDVEIGRYFFCNCNCFNLYLGVGPYFYGSECCNSLVGGMGRAEVVLCENIFLRYYITYDRIFHSKSQGEIALYIPFSSCCGWWHCLFPPLYRNEIILVEKTCRFESNF